MFSHIIRTMETLRIIEHGNGHTDIEALIFGEWVVVKCIDSNQTGETTMKELTVNQAIDLIAKLGFDEEDLIRAFDSSKKEFGKLACAFLLIAMEEA